MLEKDPYSALWVSYSSLSTFERCPRAYYLANMYKDPATGHKVSIMAPPLALGQVVHEVLESLSVLPTEERFEKALSERFEKAWAAVSGDRGGFVNEAQERKFKERGEAMIKTVIDNPGPLARRAVKIRMKLPYYWLSEKDEIILCGKIDWLEYLPDKDAIHIIDFKTGRREGARGSMQLPIYLLLASNTQKRRVLKVSYWFLEHDRLPREAALPELEAAEKMVLAAAKRVMLARKLGKLNCTKGGCRECEPYEAILRGEAKLVGVNDFSQDVYVYRRPTEENWESDIL